MITSGVDGDLPAHAQCLKSAIVPLERAEA
jgi:hypothetical protein